MQLELHVSIQLMSPASGDSEYAYVTIQGDLVGFHSINVPSEWGLVHRTTTYQQAERRFHSINVPSEWGPNILGMIKNGILTGFHSINVPSEWGP